MAACAACQEFQAERTSLRELVGSLEPVVAPPDFDMRLRARIAAQKYNDRRQPFFAQLISTPALAAAALFVIVAGSVFLISRRAPAPVVPSSKSDVVKKSEPIVPATVNQSGVEAAALPSDEGKDVAVNPSRPSHRTRTPRGGYSEDWSSTGADSVRQTDSDTAYVPSRPVEFALQDQRGNTRKISLPPVSFGAQNLVSDTRRDVAYSASSRVW